VARILLFGEAEVDQRAVPCVAKRHCSRASSPVSGKLLRHSVGRVEPQSFQVLRQIPGAGSVTLDGEIAGNGPPIVLLHGLSATRRNVVQGSRHLITRGYRLIAYDARGHGSSSPAPRYEYADLVGDLE